MKTKTFPERVERFGVCATIYAPKDESKGFTISFHIRGKLVRKVRNAYEDAKRLALSVVEQKGTGDLDVLTLGDKDRLIYLRAVEAVKPTGRPLDLIAYDYAHAIKLLGDNSLVDVVKFYLANRTRQVKSQTVEQVVSELLDNKRQNGRSKLYVTDLRLRLARFVPSYEPEVLSAEESPNQVIL